MRLPSDFKTVPGIVQALVTFLREPLFTGMGWGALNYLQEWLMQKNLRPGQNWYRDVSHLGQSVGKFLQGVLGGEDQPVRNIVGAMFHGIYGGDPWKLSARHTVLDRLWWSYAHPRPEGQVWMPRKDYFLLLELIDGWGGINRNSEEIIRLATDAAVDKWELLAFEDGLLTLLNALVKDLENSPNVTIQKSEPVTSVAYDKADRVSVREFPCYLISCLFSQFLLTHDPHRLRLRRQATSRYNTTT